MIRQMAYSRRSLLALLLGCAPAALADRSEAKRHAKAARKQAKRTSEAAKRDVADRKSLVQQKKADRKRLNQDNAELEKARRQDLADLTKRRQAHVERPVFDANAPAEEPKPGIQPVTRGVDAAAAKKSN